MSSSNHNNKKGQQKEEEQMFHILPHPAKSNNPADLEREQDPLKRSDAPFEAFHARDPYVPSKEIRDNMPPALSREELQARQAQLNKD